MSGRSRRGRRPQPPPPQPPRPGRPRRRLLWYRWGMIIVAIGSLVGVTFYLGRCRPATYEYQLIVVNTGGAPAVVARTRPVLGPPVTVAAGGQVALPALSGDDARQRVVYEVRTPEGAVQGCLTDNPETEWQRLYEAQGVRGGRLQSTLRIPESLIACTDPRLAR